MITVNSPENQPVPAMQFPDWKSAQAAAVTDPASLLALLELDPALLPAARAAAAVFPLRVPLSFVARMQKRNPDDPLLRQVLPLGLELEENAGFVTNPLKENEAVRAPGLLQKYQGRVLLTATGACGVHCRYCFRRHYPYAEQNPRKDWAAVLAAVRADDSIHEVILSGGDPFTLDTSRLKQVSADIESIPHIQRLRVHTRQPIVLPERVDDALVEWLASISLPLVIVLHVNHANEIDDHVRVAIGRLRRAGATLLNQSVLLRGINDDAASLLELSETLFDAGILPYYLHLLDPVSGAAHFDVQDARARAIVNEMHGRISGYLVPRLVREIPGKSGKTLINL